MAGIGRALISVFLRLLASLAVLAIVFVFAILGAMFGSGGPKGLVFITLYALSAWTLMPLFLLSFGATAIAATLWFGAGIHAFIYSSPGETRLFAYWCIVSTALPVALLVKYAKLSAPIAPEHSEFGTNAQDTTAP